MYVRANFFTERVINIWNSLPDMVLTSTLTLILGVLLNVLNLPILDIDNVHSKYQFDFMCFMFLLFLCLLITQFKCLYHC